MQKITTIDFNRLLQAMGDAGIYLHKLHPCGECNDCNAGDVCCNTEWQDERFCKLNNIEIVEDLPKENRVHVKKINIVDLIQEEIFSLLRERNDLQKQLPSEEKEIRLKQIADESFNLFEAYKIMTNHPDINNKIRDNK